MRKQRPAPRAVVKKMPDQNPTSAAEIAVIKTQVSDLTSTFANFMKAQGDENKNLRDAMLALKDSMATRGKLSAPVVISLLAFLTSFAAIGGGFVHFYVSNQIGGVEKDVVINRGVIAQIQESVVRVNQRAESEELRAKIADVQFQKDLEYMRTDMGVQQKRQPQLLQP